MRKRTRSAEALMTDWAEMLVWLVRWKTLVSIIDWKESKGSQTLLVLGHIGRLSV